MSADVCPLCRRAGRGAVVGGDGCVCALDLLDDAQCAADTPDVVPATIGGPSFVDRTVDVLAQACAAYRKALDAPDPGAWMGGRSVRPVITRYAHFQPSNETRNS